MRFGKEEVCSYNKNLCSVRPQRRVLRLLVCFKRIIRTSAKLKVANDVVPTSSTCKSSEFTAFLSYSLQFTDALGFLPSQKLHY